MNTQSQPQPQLSPERAAVLEKIRKILSKVNHAGGATETPEAEMNTALEMARKMFAKLDLDEGLFESLVQGTDAQKSSAFDSMVRERAYYRKDFRGIEFFIDLAYAVSYVTDTGWRYEYHNLRDKRGTGESSQTCIMFFGLPRDVAMALSLYKELVVTVHAMARFQCGKGSWTLSHNSYAFGLCERLKLRALAVQEAASSSSSPGSDSQSSPEEAARSNAIVISKKALLDRYRYDVLGYPRPLTPEQRAAMERRNAELQAKWEKEEAERKAKPGYKPPKPPKARKVRYRSMDNAAYDKGYADGANVSLGTNGIAGKPNDRLT